jgi:DNA polymerase-3 subunit epsilon
MIGQFVKDCDLGRYNLIRFDLPLVQNEFARAEVEFSLEERRLVGTLSGALCHA